MCVYIFFAIKQKVPVYTQSNATNNQLFPYWNVCCYTEKRSVKYFKHRGRKTLVLRSIVRVFLPLNYRPFPARIDMLQKNSIEKNKYLHIKLYNQCCTLRHMHKNNATEYITLKGK